MGGDVIGGGASNAILDAHYQLFDPQLGGAPLRSTMTRATFSELTAGRPLVDRFSPRYLREVGMYVYESASGEARAAISDERQLHLIETVAWTLQRRVTPELASAEDVAAAIGRVC